MKDLSKIVKSGLFETTDEFESRLQKEYPNSKIDIKFEKVVEVRIVNKETEKLEDCCSIRY